MGELDLQQVEAHAEGAADREVVGARPCRRAEHLQATTSPISPRANRIAASHPIVRTIRRGLAPVNVPATARHDRRLTAAGRRHHLWSMTARAPT